MNAKDDISGIKSIAVEYEPTVGSSTKVTFLSENSDGTYSGNISIGANDAVGLWKVSAIQLIDNAGNSIFIFNKEVYPTMPNNMDLGAGDFQVK